VPGNRSDLTYADVTSKSVYLDRRKFLRGAGIAAIAAFIGKRAYDFAVPSRSAQAGTKLTVIKSPFSTDEKINTFDVVTHYNNFYEFGVDKDQPAKNAQKFVTSPWAVAVSGEVAKPRNFSMDEILKLAPLEERIYRHRCVEGWSMVIPWDGFALSSFLKEVEPQSKAKYVKFTTKYDPSQMPGQHYGVLDWPYVEGLRLDEAMNPLAILAVGLYGDELPKQDGAPIRLVVPWKYGYKSIKSIVKISLVDKQPTTTWNAAASNEYGFYSNVNPNVDHPRWSQKKERRIGEFFKRDTLMFNGYGDQVASLYNGMDLKKYF
jgi:sulfoxide reductase catalytic subunit YedY